MLLHLSPSLRVTQRPHVLHIAPPAAWRRMGAIFFDEFAAFEPWMFASFFGGVTLSLCGIAVVATSDMSSDHPDSASSVALLPQDELLAGLGGDNGSVAP